MPNGIEPITSSQYRLSRIYSGGVDLASYGRIICYNPEYTSGLSPYFLEGFNCENFIVESARTVWSFRKNDLTPLMQFNFNKLKVVGSRISRPQIRSRLSLVTAPFDLKVDEMQDVFSVTLRDVNASPGIAIDAYNSVSYGTNTNVNFYDRAVRRIGNQRNVLQVRPKLTPTPPPERITEKILERF